MSDYSSLKATINANIKANNNHEITGAITNSVLNAMVDSLGAGYQFMGVATPTNPGTAQTPDYKCFYLATTPGTYTNLGGLVVADGEVAILKYDTSWTKEVTGAATADQVSQLGQKVHNIDLGTLVDNSYILSTNGNFTSYNGYKRTGFIPIKNFGTVFIGTGVKVNNVAAIAFYSGESNSTFISAINSGDYPVGSTVEVAVPENAAFCAMCWISANQQKVFLHLKDIPSVLQKFGNVASKVDPLNEQINAISGEIAIPFSLIDNGCINAETGGVTTASNYKYTDYVDCKRFASLSFVLAYSDSAGVAFYNKAKVYIIGYTKPSSANIGDIITLQVPDDACYVRISVLATMASSFALNSVDYPISLQIEKNNQAQLEYSLGTLQNGFINYSNGAFGSADTYRATDFIRLIGGKIKYRIYFKDGAGVAFYDEDKTYISGVGNSEGASAYGTYNEVAIPDNAVYVRYCGFKTYISSLYLQCVNDGTLIDLLNNFSPTPTPAEVNPCFYKDSGGCRTFKKILCIGDSLTQGTFEYRDGSSTITYFVDESLSYPTFLKAITGRDTTNKGDGGQTTKTWWERHQNDDLSGHDACIIALGRNDYSEGRETTTAERYEYMGNIISKVRTENPQIKVFVATMLNYYTGTDADAVNTDMRGIATQNNCYLVDISTYGELTFADDAYSHLTAEGYEKVANYYFNYISYIMAQSPADFKNIQFIGTEHYY